MERPAQYWTAVAKGIDAEDEKASVYTASHGPSLGGAREAILRHEMRKETRDPFKVVRGIVLQRATPYKLEAVSRQLDVLVYDPNRMAPYMQIDDFLVVDSNSAICGVEVKSKLTSKTFRDVLNVSKSLRDTDVDCLAFAFNGRGFNAFVKDCARAVSDSFGDVPVMIAVHKANHFAIRGTDCMEGDTSRLFLADFSAASKPQPGRATASFLSWYDARFEMQAQYGWRFAHGFIHQWFCSLDLPERALVSVAEGGEVEYGKVPR